MSSPFSRKSLAVVLSVCIGSFAVGVLLLVLGADLREIKSNRFDGFSLAATGHQGLFEILDDLDIPVFHSTWESGKRAGERGVLMLLQSGEHTAVETFGGGGYTVPASGGESPTPLQQLHDAVETAATTCFVLPKWIARSHGRDPEWIDAPSLLHPDRYPQILDLIDLNAEVVRPPPGTPLHWNDGGFGAAPTLHRPQLLKSAMLDPIISTARGILVGEMWVEDEPAPGPYDGELEPTYRRIVVVSDPDLLSNQGILQGDNALIAVGLIEMMRHGGSVIFDATAHGHIIEPSLIREAFRFPMALIPIHTALCVLVLLWVGMGRFGTPARPVRRFRHGNQALIRNTADLLRFGGHTSTALRSYLRETIEQVRRGLHMPEGLDRAARNAWLARVETARGVSLRYRDVMGRARPLLEIVSPPSERVLAVARLAYAWRQEILHGPASSQVDS